MFSNKVCQYKMSAVYYCFLPLAIYYSHYSLFHLFNILRKHFQLIFDCSTVLLIKTCSLLLLHNVIQTIILNATVNNTGPILLHRIFWRAFHYFLMTWVNKCMCYVDFLCTFYLPNPSKTNKMPPNIDFPFWITLFKDFANHVNEKWLKNILNLIHILSFVSRVWLCKYQFNK